MDEPLHANENRFWDQVADWLIDGPAPVDDDEVTDAEIEAMLRALRDDLDPR